VLTHPALQSGLRLEKENFNIAEFWIYRALRLLLLPFGRKLSINIAVRLHWIFRHLAIAVSGRGYGVDFLNSRSAIIQGDFLKLYVKQGDSVIDVACGTARYYPTILAIGGVQYLGIDSSSLHISRNMNSMPDGQFINANCLEEGVIPECDVIIASHFIEHIENPLDFLLKIKNRCSKLIIEVPDFYSDPINLVSFNLGTPWWTDRDHFREYSEVSLEALLIEAGYKLLDQKISGGTIAVVAEASR
jgi:SAM-dependent methyltransferase